MFLKRGRLADFSKPPSNPNASIGCRLLYARLRNFYGTPAGSACPMAIGVNETAAATPYYQVNGNRLQELTGKQALLMAPFWGGPGSPGYAEQVARVKAHHAAGGMCGTIWHPNNLLTGGNNYDRDRDSGAAVTACLSPGGSKLTEYRAALDVFAASLNNDFVDDKGVPIPMLVRTAGEANGWYDYPDMSIDSLSRTGTTATMHFTRGANPIGSPWAAGSCKFQLRGVTNDTAWNKLWIANTYVQDGNGNGGTVTFTVPNTLNAAPTGTRTCYPAAGAWWAGADRAADLNELVRQTITYLRDVKGCNQLLWAPNLFTWNRIYLSSNPATYPYSLWLDGMDDYYDFMSVNLYQDEPTSWGFCDFGNQNVVDGFQPYVDWCNARGRPIVLYEFGARYDGATTADFWGRRCFDAFDRTNFRRLAAAVFWSPTWMPTDGTPAVPDFQQALGESRYRWLGQ